MSAVKLKSKVPLNISRRLLVPMRQARPSPARSLRLRLRSCDRVLVNPALASWAESFIFSGSSALLLLTANLSSAYWYFSFFALTPFLYRILKASPVESLRLGFLLGLSYFGALAVNTLAASPHISMVKLFSGAALFALFGWLVGRARQRWGFNVSLVALLWVGLELGSVKLGFVSGIFGKGGLSHPSLHGLVGLFGFLAVSAIVVLLNSLLALAIARTLKVTRTSRDATAEDRSTSGLTFARNLFTEKVYLVPQGRAPPHIITGVSSFSLTNRFRNIKL
jgi:apolipoprotein N-acyltransferase